MQLCGFTCLIFRAALCGDCEVSYCKCCGSSGDQRFQIVPHDCKCAADGDVEDVGRAVRSLRLNFARAVVCHAEQPIVAVSELSESFFYSGSSFLADGLFHNTIITRCTFVLKF